jgi:type III secretory pathway component EscV
MGQNELALVAALALLAFCGSLIGFPFVASLAVTLSLGIIFYLLQTKREPESDE